LPVVHPNPTPRERAWGAPRSGMSDKFFALTAAFVLCASTAVVAQSRSVDQVSHNNRTGHRTENGEL
jgi:hypothetical protein